MLSADGALMDIVGYVCIYAGPIHCLSHLSLHLINPLMCCMQIGKGMIEQFQGNADSCPLEKARVNGKFFPGSPRMSGNLGELMPALRPTLWVRQ